MNYKMQKHQSAWFTMLQQHAEESSQSQNNPQEMLATKDGDQGSYIVWLMLHSVWPCRSGKWGARLCLLGHLQPPELAVHLPWIGSCKHAVPLGCDMEVAVSSESLHPQACCVSLAGGESAAPSLPFGRAHTPISFPDVPPAICSPLEVAVCIPTTLLCFVIRPFPKRSGPWKSQDLS